MMTCTPTVTVYFLVVPHAGAIKCFRVHIFRGQLQLFSEVLSHKRPTGKRVRLAARPKNNIQIILHLSPSRIIMFHNPRSKAVKVSLPIR